MYLWWYFSKRNAQQYALFLHETYQTFLKCDIPVVFIEQALIKTQCFDTYGRFRPYYCVLPDVTFSYSKSLLRRIFVIFKI
jgi:hypothetical protein